MSFSKYSSSQIRALDTSSLAKMLVSYEAINTPEITIPTYDDSWAPRAMIAQGDFKQKVENLKTKFKESPVFQESPTFQFEWTGSTPSDIPSTPTNSSDASTNSSSSFTSSYPSTAEFIKKEEGFKDHRYKDAGGQSIGYGFYGTRYYSGDHITREEADKVLDGIIKEQEANFSRYPIWNKLNNNQKTALHSYVYNVGSITSKLKDALLSEDLTKIHDAISITTSQGKRSEVLVERRNKEKALFNS